MPKVSVKAVVFAEVEVEDECAGTSHVLDSFWSYYEDDMKVDSEGNAHFVIQVLPCESTEEGFCWYTSVFIGDGGILAREYALAEHDREQ
mgnify:CR=1 FL=1